MFKMILIASAMLAVAASPAVAREKRAAAAADTQVSTTSQSDDPRQKYCVVGAVTGSRLQQKVCKTRAEWLREDFDPLVKN